MEGCSSLTKAAGGIEKRMRFVKPETDPESTVVKLERQNAMCVPHNHTMRVWQISVSGFDLSGIWTYPAALVLTGTASTRLPIHNVYTTTTALGAIKSIWTSLKALSAVYQFEVLPSVKGCLDKLTIHANHLDTVVGEVCRFTINIYHAPASDSFFVGLMHVKTATTPFGTMQFDRVKKGFTTLQPVKSGTGVPTVTSILNWTGPSTKIPLATGPLLHVGHAGESSVLLAAVLHDTYLTMYTAPNSVCGMHAALAMGHILVELHARNWFEKTPPEHGHSGMHTTTPESAMEELIVSGMHVLLTSLQISAPGVMKLAYATALDIIVVTCTRWTELWCKWRSVVYMIVGKLGDLEKRGPVKAKLAHVEWCIRVGP
jgi:hypothetical protein